MSIAGLSQRDDEGHGVMAGDDEVVAADALALTDGAPVEGEGQKAVLEENPQKPKDTSLELESQTPRDGCQLADFIPDTCVTCYKSQREQNSRECARTLPLVDWAPPLYDGCCQCTTADQDANKNRVGDLWCCPFPYKEQRVCLCGVFECLREVDDQGKEDPFSHHACSPWWCGWIGCAADPSTIVDFRTSAAGIERFGKDGYMTPIFEKFGWNTEEPSFGSKQNFNPWEDNPKCDALQHSSTGWCLINHINGMTVERILKMLYSGPKSFYTLMLAVQAIIIPCIAVGILYGLVPVSNDPSKCSWSNSVGVMFWANPIGEVMMMFGHCMLLFTSVDNDLPWRPFSMYVGLLIAGYFAQVGVYGILALTKTYAMNQMVIFSRLLGLILELGWMCVMEDTILCFRKNTAALADLPLDSPTKPGCCGRPTHCKPEEVSKEARERYKAFKKYLIIEFLFLVYFSVYIWLTNEYAGSSSWINFGFTVCCNFFRVAFQGQTSVMHRDMNFMLAFLTVYTYKSMVLVFMSPAFGDNLLDFFTAALSPISTIGVALMHQMSIWHRFRGWIKKVYEPVLMSLCCWKKRNNPLTWPIPEDYNKNGRGSSSSIPEYRRTKVQYDIIKFVSQIAGYGSYMGVLLFLRWGPNRKNFPYSNEGLATLQAAGENASRTEYKFEFENMLIPMVSIIPLRIVMSSHSCFSVVASALLTSGLLQGVLFSAVVVFWLMFWLWFYLRWIKKFYGPLTPISDEFLAVFYREPQKLAAFNILISNCLIMTVRMFSSYGTVYYFQYNRSQFGTTCMPFDASAADGFGF